MQCDILKLGWEISLKATKKNQIPQNVHFPVLGLITFTKRSQVSLSTNSTDVFCFFLPGTGDEKESGGTAFGRPKVENLQFAHVTQPRAWQREPNRFFSAQETSRARKLSDRPTKPQSQRRTNLLEGWWDVELTLPSCKSPSGKRMG